MQTFEKGDANFRYFSQFGEGCESENLYFESKMRGVNCKLVSGLKLHDFEIICPARGMRLHPRTTPVYSLLQ